MTTIISRLTINNNLDLEHLCNVYIYVHNEYLLPTVKSV